jgi:regulator of replication initiation timing
MLRELEELRAELSVLRKEKSIMLEQVGSLQAENTALAARVGKMGLQEIKEEVGKGGRSRSSSLKGLARAATYRSSSSSGEKENLASPPSMKSNGS